MSTSYLAVFQNEPVKKTIPAGRMLFQIGDPGVYMYVLLKGTAQIRVEDVVVELAGPGSIIGEMALIDAQPRSASVVCVSECQFAQIDRPRFEFLVRQNPQFSLEVMRIMSERLRATNHML